MKRISPRGQRWHRASLWRLPWKSGRARHLDYRVAMKAKKANGLESCLREKIPRMMWRERTLH